MPDFIAVKTAERVEIKEARRRRRALFSDPNELLPEPEDDDTTGVAFSGGGIRSATFNLGILQGLARYNLLQRVDYISTVSGGGYIGSWLISWIRRSGLQATITGLSSSPPTPPVIPGPPAAVMGQAVPPTPPQRTYAEAKAINFLRAYSNYLTPRLGVLSGDVWAAVASYVRNLLLNLTILILSLSAVLLMPRLWQAIFIEIAAGGKSWFRDQWLGFEVASASLFCLAICYAIWNIASYAFPESREDRFTKQGWILLLVVAPLFVAAGLGSIALWIGSWNLSGVSWSRWAAWGSVILALVRSIGLILTIPWHWRWRLTPTSKWQTALEAVSWVAGWAIVAGAAEGLLVSRTARRFWDWAPFSRLALVILGISVLLILIRFALKLCNLPVWDEWQRAVWDASWDAGFAFAAGALGGVLVGWIARMFSAWAPLIPCFPAPPTSSVAKVACWGTSLLVGAFLLTGVLHIGLLSLEFANEKREWWARGAGLLLICCLIGAGLFWLAIYAPLQVRLLSKALKSGLGVSWLVSTFGGLLAGKSGSTSGRADGNPKLEILAKVAPFVFVLGLLVALSTGTHWLVSSSAGGFGPTGAGKAQGAQVSGNLTFVARDAAGETSPTLTELKLSYSTKATVESVKITEDFWDEVQRSAEKGPILGVSLPGWSRFLCFVILLITVALVLSTHVDINEFSMHLFYRNRLVRCYLGASNKDRRPQLFTGFDPNDDTFLKDFSVKAKPYKDTHGKRIKYAGPYPILNCTLTVTHGDRLAWQERKGESFIFTPRYCGYEFQEQSPMEADRVGMDGQWDEELGRLDRERFEKKDKRPDGYQKTGGYAYPPEGVYLGTAVATSGAAVNPNMGFHTSPALAFLMTLFNVRLGWWLGNPRNPKARRRATPLFGMFYLLMELFALTSDRSRYINLSDGFHFENLGLYELVRRRCRYIVVGDAGADPKHSFDDLGNAIRKCRTDFGVEIELDLSRLKLQKDKVHSTAHSVAGTIHYELIDPKLKPGVLVYLKPTLTKNDPVDVQNYGTLHPAFPHQSTANQWFDESQFESYRQLGRVSIGSTLERIGTPKSLASMSTEGIFRDLKRTMEYVTKDS